MTTYTASKMATGIQPRFLPSAGGVNVLSTISQTTALALNDIIQMMQLGADASDPAGSGPTIIGLLLDVDALDSGNTLTLDVGDTLGGAAIFYSQITTARAGGYAIPNVNGTLGYQPFATAFATYTTISKATDTVQIKCHAAPTTWANGNLRLLVEYSFDP